MIVMFELSFLVERVRQRLALQGAKNSKRRQPRQRKLPRSGSYTFCRTLYPQRLFGDRTLRVITFSMTQLVKYLAHVLPNVSYNERDKFRLWMALKKVDGPLMRSPDAFPCCVLGRVASRGGSLRVAGGQYG